MFAKPVFFGPRPSHSYPSEIRNGTITLADLGSGPLGITCHHVLDSYRKLREQSGDILFQIGDQELDPLSQLVDQNERLDIAVLKLPESQVTAITSTGTIGSCLFRPKQWPCEPATRGSYVAFGGFPGKLKNITSLNEIEFGSWSSGASHIDSASDIQFVSAFDRAYWVKSFGSTAHMELSTLGGMSGGPAFINRGLYWDFVGIVSEYQDNYDAVFFSSTAPIRHDGTIEPPPI